MSSLGKHEAAIAGVVGGFIKTNHPSTILAAFVKEMLDRAFAVT